MTDRNEIFSGTKQVDDKLKIDKESLNDYLCLLYTSPSPRD